MGEREAGSQGGRRGAGAAEQPRVVVYAGKGLGFRVWGLVFRV